MKIVLYITAFMHVYMSTVWGRDAVAQSVERWTLNPDDSGSSPGERTISTKSYPPSTHCVDILGYQKLVHLIPCIYGMGCKRSLVLKIEVRVSVYLIIIIRRHIAINELMRRKTIFNLNLNLFLFKL